MADTLPTTENVVSTEYGLGSAHSSRPGFQQTSDNLPASEDVWGEYFNGVMRGDTDGYSGESLPIAMFSRTFSDNSPPEITLLTIDGDSVGAHGAGSPDGGFVPSPASPGEGNGANASAIPALNGDFAKSLSFEGAGFSQNGSVLNPHEGAGCQENQDAFQSGVSPNYSAGTYGWSDGVSPLPGSS